MEELKSEIFQNYLEILFIGVGILFGFIVIFAPICIVKIDLTHLSSFIISSIILGIFALPMVIRKYQNNIIKRMSIFHNRDKDYDIKRNVFDGSINQGLHKIYEEMKDCEKYSVIFYIIHYLLKIYIFMLFSLTTLYIFAYWKLMPSEYFFYKIRYDLRNSLFFYIFNIHCASSYIIVFVISIVIILYILSRHYYKVAVDSMGMYYFYRHKLLKEIPNTDISKEKLCKIIIGDSIEKKISRKKDGFNGQHNYVIGRYKKLNFAIMIISDSVALPRIEFKASKKPLKQNPYSMKISLLKRSYYEEIKSIQRSKNQSISEKIENIKYKGLHIFILARFNKLLNSIFIGEMEKA